MLWTPHPSSPRASGTWQPRSLGWKRPWAAPAHNELPAPWKAASNEELQGKSKAIFSHRGFVCVGLLEGKAEARSCPVQAPKISPASNKSPVEGLKCAAGTGFYQGCYSSSAGSSNYKFLRAGVTFVSWRLRCIWHC